MMSVQALTQNAYGDATRATGTPRGVEYQVFSQITGQLNRATQAGRPFSELAMALHENLRLWTVIATDVVSTENGLPVPLRARLADLSKFTRSHTQKVLRNEADAGVLIEINTAVMRGLRGQLPPRGA
jgi:flagellar protein FlaF